MGAGEPTVSLNYNKANRVGTIAENGAQIAQYLYDGFGQRLVKNFSGTPVAGVLFDYGQDGSLLEETNISGKAQADYIYLDGMPIGDYAPGTKTLYYLHTDHLGTPQLATNSAKAIEWQAIYEPFGWQNTVSGTITQNLRLPGQYFDSETTSYHNGFRDYVAILGRYGQSDQIGLSGGTNTYAYANLNPGKFTDVSGDQFKSTIDMANGFTEGRTVSYVSIPSPADIAIGAAISSNSDLFSYFPSQQGLSNQLNSMSTDIGLGSATAFFGGNFPLSGLAGVAAFECKAASVLLNKDPLHAAQSFIPDFLAERLEVGPFMNMINFVKDTLDHSKEP
jgi:RHS repeat-associated protein